MQTGARLRGLDRLRFILAAWVVLGHFGPHLTEGRPIVRLVVNNLFDAPAAVIAFFVISGLCVHFPQRASRSVAIWRFYSRRYLRILPPAAIAVGLAFVVGASVEHVWSSTMWSLLCEEIYYALYPLLLVAARRYGWPRLIVAAYLGAFVVLLATRGDGPGYTNRGYLFTWLVGLPCWLLGCQLAERRPRLPGTVWQWRVAVFLVSCLIGVITFHTPIGAPWTLDAFAVLCAAWLAVEIDRAPPDSGWLSKAGATSYSVYLLHVIAYSALEPLGLPGYVRCFAIFPIAFAFYFLVEAPFHRLARAVGQRPVGQERPVPAV
jgi:peptidoglycan/LPS O-acetylase OafA/YrhL